MDLKQPCTLLDRASYVLAKEIGNQVLVASNNESITKMDVEQLAKFYDDNIPRNLHNFVTHRALKHIAGNELVITGDNLFVSDLVLRKHVTKFNFRNWPMEMHSMLYANLSKLSDLQILHLSLGHEENENLNYVLQGIEGMKQLEIFKCSDCNDDIVKVLCENCPLISLEFQESESFVSDESVPSILKLQNLLQLDIKQTSISKEGQKQLLLGLPRLESLICGDLNLVLQETGERKFTSLLNVELHISNENDVINLTESCPFIRKLDIINDKSLDLSVLANLESLTSLDTNSDICECNVLSVLETRGYQITALDIPCKNVRTLYLVDEFCPNLGSLCLSGNTFIDDNENVTEMNRKIFRNLKYFTICAPNCAGYIILLLCNCRKLIDVDVFAHTELSDGDIDTILSSNPLLNLEKLLYVGNLSAQSVHRLVRSCKQMKYIGFTEHWKSVTKSELKELHSFVIENNLDVTFIINDDSLHNPIVNSQNNLLL